MELLARHRRPVDAVAARLRANVDHRIARAARLGVKNLVLADQSQRKRIHQRIAAVTGLELRLAAQIRHAKAVAVSRHAAHYAVHNRMILVDLALVHVLARLSGDRPKAQRIHHRQRPRAHGKDVAQNAAHARRRALKRLDVAGVVVALNLEGAGPPIAHVDDAGILARPLHHARALGGQPLQMHAAGLVGAVLAPHHAVNAQLGERRHTPQRGLDAAILLRGDAVLGQQLRGNRNRLGKD